VRYESYGLNVAEAFCCGVPAMVTSDAGVAERYPAALSELLIRNPEDADALAGMMLRWRIALNHWKRNITSFSQTLRQHTLETMAAQIVSIAESEAGRLRERIFA
jgi:glycosyltransferase involved in cell wall biosynthesis